MSDSPLRKVGPLAPAPAPRAVADVHDQQQLEALRGILLHPEQEQLRRLEHRLNDPYERSKDLGELLPSAISARNEKNPNDLTKALTPNIGPALHQAIERDKNSIAGVLMPVIFPAVKQAIANAMSEFVQSFDQAMQYRFSPQSLKWRFEAWTTGKKFSEVVMYHSLIYRVEQALLIHKKTGLLLWEETQPNSKYKDAGMVSSLLTAINDFARESFSANESQVLRKLDHDDLEIWIEGGTPPYDLAFLAVVIRGNAPESLRNELRETLIQIHNTRREALLSFNGDNVLFEACEHDLQKTLRESRRSATTTGQNKKRLLPPSLAVPLALLLLGLLIWGWLNWRDHRRWNAYLTRLQNEPGILVTEQQSRYGLLGSRFTLSGLRDPLAQDPAKLLRELTPLNPARVTSRWQGYYALDARMVTARAAQVLEPPNSVKLETRDGVLYASGSATRAWIETARRLTRALPGVLRFDTQQLLDADQERLLVMQRELEKNRLQFATGTARLIAGQEAELQKIALRLKDAVALADYTKRPLTIEIIGQTDSTGTEEINKPLRLARARSILTQLAGRGIPRNHLTASAGLPPTQKAETSDQELQRNRAVTFKITLANPQ